MAMKPTTVSQLNEYIKKTIRFDPILSNVFVKGQISDLKWHSNGYIFFTISDDFCSIRCFVPVNYAEQLTEEFKTGDEVLINGYIDVYKKNGTYSLIVKDIETIGAGDALKDLEELKKKLKKEGIFDANHKLPIPKFPNRIGVITSKTGAALQDIIKIIKKNNNYVNVIVFPVLVQGSDAPISIINAIEKATELSHSIDTLILSRGGGSQEDLAVFNHEGIARAIYDCPIPIISAVGHEIDTTICDFVADARGETPTAAAQMAVPNIEDIYDYLDGIKTRLELDIKNAIRLNRAILDKRKLLLKEAINNKTIESRHRLAEALILIKENDPQNIMNKGYSALIDSAGHSINSVKNLESSMEYQLLMKDGKAKVRIMEVIDNNEQ